MLGPINDKYTLLRNNAFRLNEFNTHCASHDIPFPCPMTEDALPAHEGSAS